MACGFKLNTFLRSFDGSTFLQPVTCKPHKCNDLKKINEFPFIARGSCSSYILSCCDEESVSIDMSDFNFISSFDEVNGILIAQSGIMISTVVLFLAERGFILPVVPGNPFATLGGAVAANVHGKNCFKNNVIYDHILSLKIALSSGKQILCFPGEPLFECTVGGYGVTGIILEVKIKCSKCNFNGIKSTNYSVKSLKEAGQKMPILQKHDFLYSTHFSNSPYQNSEGFIIAGDYTTIPKIKENKEIDKYIIENDPNLQNPFLKMNKNIPSFWNPLTINLAQQLFFLKTKLDNGNSIPFYDFFFPLNKFKSYYSFFGNKGLLESQVLIPHEVWPNYCDEFLNIINNHKLNLTILSLKLFRGKDRLLSFSGNGLSLTFDCPYSIKAISVLNKLDEINSHYGVKSNINKDRRLTSRQISKQYDLNEFLSLLEECKKQLNPLGEFKTCNSIFLKRILN